MLPKSGQVFNRKAVQEALTHALNLWKFVTAKDYPNGAIVFCSDDIAEILHPPTPLKRRLYNCGPRFDTSIIEDAIEAQLGATYGLVVIDGSDAAFGKVKGLSVSSGLVITDLGRLPAHIASRTRRGGQSALRYSRLRDEAELAFLRKVADRASAVLTDVKGLVVAGKADMKHKLQAELPLLLQKQVLCTVSLSCDANSDALYQAALRASESLATAEQAGPENTVKQFLDLSVSGSLCCYGEMQTVSALKMGAVEQLLLSVDAKTLLSLDEWKALAEAHGARLFQVRPRSEQAATFCQSFGVGACLRWAVDQELLEEEVCESPASLTEPIDDVLPPNSGICNDELSKVDVGVLDSDGGSTTPSSAEANILKRAEVLSKFEQRLGDTLGDTSAAEALTACIEVVLADEESPREDVVEGVLAIARSEGVPENMVLELLDKW